MSPSCLYYRYISHVTAQLCSETIVQTRLPGLCFCRHEQGSVTAGEGREVNSLARRNYWEFKTNWYLYSFLLFIGHLTFCVLKDAHTHVDNRLMLSERSSVQLEEPKSLSCADIKEKSGIWLFPWAGVSWVDHTAEALSMMMVVTTNTRQPSRQYQLQGFRDQGIP